MTYPVFVFVLDTGIGRGPKYWVLSAQAWYHSNPKQHFCSVVSWQSDIGNLNIGYNMLKPMIDFITGHWLYVDRLTTCQ